METKRPRLDNPVEFAIIKQIYFKDDNPFFDDNLDPIEKLDRLDSKLRQGNKSSR